MRRRRRWANEDEMLEVDIKKATHHVNQNEGLIFERSSPGKKGYRLPPLDVPDVDAAKAAGHSSRAQTWATCRR